MSHIQEDVKHFQCPLSKINAFAFENELGHMEKLLCGVDEPQKQFCYRMKEKEMFAEKVKLPPEVEICTKNKTSGVIKKVKYYRYTLYVNKPNNIVLLKNDTYFKIERFQEKEKNLFVEGRNIHILKIALDHSFEEICRKMKIINVDENIQLPVKKYTINHISTKGLIFKIFENDEKESESVIMPFFH